jgi:rhomboid protease GluP
VKQKNSLTTYLIIVICGFYFTAQYYPNILHLSLPLQQELFLIKSAYFPDGQLHGVDQGEYWRLITVALTHGSITHLLFNMLALWQLGTIIEQIYGKAKYTIIMLGALLAGSAASYFFNPSNVPAVGASGMIFGLFSALLVTSRKHGIDYKNVVGVIVINLLITFLVPNIDWHAHVGGLVGGALTTYLVGTFNRPQKRLGNI